MSKESNEFAHQFDFTLKQKDIKSKVKEEAKL